MSGLSADRSSLIIFPFPMDMLKAFMSSKDRDENDKSE